MSLPRNFKEATRTFSDERRSREFLIKRRWPKGVACPTCGSTSVYFDSSRQGWECTTRHPKRKFTLKTGTIFEDSPLDLGKWLLAIWLVANRAQVTTYEVARTIGVTQKTSFLMLQRIRLAIGNPE